MTLRIVCALAELRANPMRAVKQLLFYVPIVLVALFVTLVGVLPAMNQIAFLQNAPYEGYELREEQDGQDGGLFYSKAYALVGEVDDANSLAIEAMKACDAYCFAEPKDVDFDIGPFAREMIADGIAPEALDYYDVIISEQIFNALGVKIGDTVLVESCDDEKEQYISCTLKGVLKCKYAMGGVFAGGDGVMLLRLPVNGEGTEDFLGQALRVSYVASAPDGFQGISKAEEESDAFESSTSLTAVGVIAILMAAMLLLVLARETAHIMKTEQRTLAIYNALGLPVETYASCVRWREMTVLLIADVISIVLARMIVQSSLIQLIFPFQFCIAAAIVLLVVEYVVVRVAAARLTTKINKAELSELLSKSEA